MSEEVQSTEIVNENEVSIETGNNVLDVLEQTGLNWTVRKEDLVSTSGLITPNSGVFRNDNNEWLGTVSKKYTPYQNGELVKTIVDASNHIGLYVESGGILNKGKKVFVQLGLPEEFIGNSSVKRYITALNHHNGLGSVAFGSTNTVVVCQNTFYRAYKELQKFRHHANAFDKIKMAVMELNNTIKEDVKLMETFKLMASIKMEDEVIDKVVKECFAVDLNSNTDATARQLKKRDSILQSIQTEQGLEGNTMWGLFNGVTRHTNHGVTRSAGKLDYIMSGQGYITNLKAYDTIVDWIDKNTAETVPTLN